MSESELEPLVLHEHGTPKQARVVQKGEVARHLVTYVKCRLGDISEYDEDTTHCFLCGRPYLFHDVVCSITDVPQAAVDHGRVLAERFGW